MKKNIIACVVCVVLSVVTGSVTSLLILNGNTNNEIPVIAQQGEKGEAGAVGPVGPKGEKGEAGAVGPKGEKGDTGAKGDGLRIFNPADGGSYKFGDVVCHKGEIYVVNKVVNNKAEILPANIFMINLSQSIADLNIKVDQLATDVGALRTDVQGAQAEAARANQRIDNMATQ